jgi:hypothetical protein
MAEGFASPAAASADLDWQAVTDLVGVADTTIQRPAETRAMPKPEGNW